MKEPESERLVRLLIATSLPAMLNSPWLSPIGSLLCCDLRIVWLESFIEGFDRFGVGTIFILGFVLLCAGTYGIFPWFEKHNNSLSATFIGIALSLFAFFMGHGGSAERNKAYLKGYDDGLHSRPPVDYRLSSSSEIMIEHWRKQQQHVLPDARSK